MWEHHSHVQNKPKTKFWELQSRTPSEAFAFTSQRPTDFFYYSFLHISKNEVLYMPLILLQKEETKAVI